MKITAITIQARNNNRVNVSVDGKYRFSLDSYQLLDLGLKVGADYSEPELETLEQESVFGKLYGRALEYCLMRVRSAREVSDYLFRKTRPTRDKTGNLRPGVPTEITKRVFDRLTEKGYINDEKFTQFWVDNRSLSKGVSRRKLVSELHKKGVSNLIIDKIMGETDRNDSEEIKKIVAKKRSRYPDKNKFIAYLARQGFSYDDIKQEIGDY